VRLDSIIKKAGGILKRAGNFFHRKDESAEIALLIPGDNYLKLRSRYYSYKNLLLKNNELLDTLSEIEEGIETKTITLQVFRSYISRIFDTAFGFIQSLNDMADNRYMYLYDVLERIRLNTESLLREEEEKRLVDFVVPLAKITSEHFKDTGSKAGNLGEIRNILKLPVPRGFSITAKAYRHLISLNHLEDRIDTLLAPLDMNDTAGIERVSDELQGLIMDSRVPQEIEEAVCREADRLGRQPGFSVRSSAVGEDGKVSFAGQFTSKLNVTRESLIHAYKEVVASKYSMRAIFYRLAKKIKDRDTPMCVLVLEMIDSRTSGVLYTMNPSYPERDETMISAVWGQGQYAVSGTVSPDMYILNRRENGRILSKTISRKDVMLVLNPPGGVTEVPVPEESREAPCLSDDEIRTLYDFSRLIERHFGAPQDIEWAIDEKGRIMILQARPLHIKRVITAEAPDTYDETLTVLSRGETASRGIASGPAYIIEKFDQISGFPDGAVLVARNTSNEFVRIMPAASAIVIETGSRTSHLATVAREFNIPMIINAGNIIRVLSKGTLVTVDANAGRIYRGRMEGIPLPGWEAVPAGQYGRDERVIRNVMKNITPLHLINIVEGETDPGDFRTIHDIIRFVHEVSVKEMFRIGELSEGEGYTQEMVTDRIPMHFYVIDLDGGVVDEAKFLRRLSPEHIRSIPFRALWRGMTHEGVRWSGPVDIDMAGLASVMARSFVRTGVTEKGGKVYVIITDQYINLSVKLAYHFSVVDAFCGESYINNYINLRFQGGGAGAEGRARRALFLKDVLESMDFRVEIKGDMVLAGIKGASRAETENKLDMLGRLLGCSRQLDMAINSIEAKDWYVRAFLEGNYSFVHD